MKTIILIFSLILASQLKAQYGPIMKAYDPKVKQMEAARESFLRQLYSPLPSTSTPEQQALKSQQLELYKIHLMELQVQAAQEQAEASSLAQEAEFYRQQQEFMRRSAASAAAYQRAQKK